MNVGRSKICNQNPGELGGASTPFATLIISTCVVTFLLISCEKNETRIEKTPEKSKQIGMTTNQGPSEITTEEIDTAASKKVQHVQTPNNEIQKKITIEEIITAASKGNPEDQVPTWHHSFIDQRRLLATVAHLPQVLQKDALREKVESYREKVFVAAREDRTLNTLREVFSHETTPETKILERRPAGTGDTSEIYFIQVSYPKPETAPITNKHPRSGIVKGWIVEMKTDLATGSLLDAAIVTESLELYPKSPLGSRPITLDKSSPPGTNVRMWGIDMVWCPPGEYLRGSPESEPGRDQFNEGQHRVILTNGFWIAQTELTQRQWLGFADLSRDTKPVGPEYPAYDFAREDIMRFLAMINLHAPLPEGLKWNIPTEAQWEYACRAGSPYVHKEDISDIAWYGGRYGGSFHPVRLKRPNAWGLYDMLGNASEVCLDGYGRDVNPESDNHYDRLYDVKGNLNTKKEWVFTDPIRRFDGTGVARGGSYQSPRHECRPASREAFSPYQRGGAIRLVVSSN